MEEQGCWFPGRDGDGDVMEAIILDGCPQKQSLRQCLGAGSLFGRRSQEAAVREWGRVMPEGIRELLHSTSKGIRRVEGGALIPLGLRAEGHPC